MNKVELLIKPVSYQCNLECTYCFYQKTADLYPNRNLRMRPDILGKMISQSMKTADGEACVFSWQGGEPLLAGVEFFRQVVELQKKWGRPGQIVSNTIQTNATLLNRSWISLFHEYNFLVGVSLDGPRHIHDYYRRQRSGQGTFDQVVKGIRLLREGRVEFNILSTIGRKTAQHADKIYRFFLSQGFHYLQFIPAVDRSHGKIQEFSILPSQYGDFLCALFDAWWNHGSPAASIRLFDNILEMLLYGRASSCMFKPECGEYIVIESSGDAYPCDFFVRREWKLGNIGEANVGQLLERARSRFGRLKRHIPSDCDRCRWRFICPNGCLWFRWVKNGSMLDKGYFCESYKRFFPYAVERFEKLRDFILVQTGHQFPRTREQDSRLSRAT